LRKKGETEDRGEKGGGGGGGGVESVGNEECGEGLVEKPRRRDKRTKEKKKGKIRNDNIFSTKKGKKKLSRGGQEDQSTEKDRAVSEKKFLTLGKSR